MTRCAGTDRAGHPSVDDTQRLLELGEVFGVVEHHTRLLDTMSPVAIGRFAISGDGAALESTVHSLARLDKPDRDRHRPLPVDKCRRSAFTLNDQGRARPVEADREGVDDLPEMLTVGELARLLHVHPKTISRWCRDGKLDALVTPGGHRRIPLAAVLDLLRGMGLTEQAALKVVRSVR